MGRELQKEGVPRPKNDLTPALYRPANLLLLCWVGLLDCGDWYNRLGLTQAPSRGSRYDARIILA
jgi:hypothetical protein